MATRAFDIDVQDLGVRYRVGKTETRALERVNLHIRASEFACLIGPSGCGKTTLLNTVAGFLEPSEGRILIDGRPVDSRIDKGVVFQEYALFPWRTSIGNVEFGLEMKGIAPKERRETALRYLRLVRLEASADSYPHRLSGGMKQRVAIARALAFDPAVLLMDEPFGALDSFAREELQRLLVDVWLETGKTILYVTHNVAEAVYLADRIVVFSPHPGRIVRELAVELPRPRDPLTAEFVAYQREVARFVVQ